MPTIKKLARVVNTGLQNEPEYYALQIIETNRIFQFSEIKCVLETGTALILETPLNDNDLHQPIIQKILNQGHIINVSYFEPEAEQMQTDQWRNNLNADLTLHF